MHKIKNKIKYLLAIVALFFPALVLAATDHPIADILTKILLWLLDIFGIVALIGFLVSGILYLTAGGSEDRLDRAKKSFTYSILGVLIAAMGMILIKTIEARLSGQ